VRVEFDADVVWLPFELHPDYPPEGIPLADLHRRYGFGTGEADPLRERFAAAGLEYNRPDTVPNTRLAHRVTELAREQSLHEPFLNRLMDAYWSEATNIGDPDALRRLATEIGLDQDEVERVISNQSAYSDVVDSSMQQAGSININAVPAFLIDRRLIVLGAQPFEVFERAFEQLAA